LPGRRRGQACQHVLQVCPRLDSQPLACRRKADEHCGRLAATRRAYEQDSIRGRLPVPFVACRPGRASFGVRRGSLLSFFLIVTDCAGGAGRPETRSGQLLRVGTSVHFSWRPRPSCSRRAAPLRAATRVRFPRRSPAMDRIPSAAASPRRAQASRGPRAAVSKRSQRGHRHQTVPTVAPSPNGGNGGRRPWGGRRGSPCRTPESGTIRKKERSEGRRTPNCSRGESG
jgi:hypothetical protein